jgi:hypothetical protein
MLTSAAAVCHESHKLAHSAQAGRAPAAAAAATSSSRRSHSRCAEPLDPNGNYATVAYLNAIARAEGLDLEARLGSPAGLGIHNKLVLVRRGGRGWLYVGSLNGSETAAKTNREVALQVQSERIKSVLPRPLPAAWGRKASVSPRRQHGCVHA